VLDGIHHFRHGDIARIARRLGDEARRPDGVTSLSAESLVLEMLAIAAGVRPDSDAGGVPLWLERAREMIHGCFQDAPTVEAIATEVGVHRVHLARSFRAHYHVPVGTYIRRLRLEWSATRLLDGDEGISSIALRAGFADQSHFTRAFKHHLGVPPGEFRRRHGP
jgi:AraC family transcriptional regulator